MRVASMVRALGGITACVWTLASAAGAQNRPTQPQTRPHGQRVDVPAGAIKVDDGDTFDIVWAEADTEIVRILGIDTPETRHDAHNIPQDQDGGPEARAFGRGAVAFADRVEILRTDKLDPYGRTLAYIFMDGRNYSVEVVKAHLAYESVSHYGDNGFPEEAKAVLAAAQVAGKPPFEPPHEFRRRMREAVQGAGKK
jgi:endonuclease YncB( thermonuclease family)